MAQKTVTITFNESGIPSPDKPEVTANKDDIIRFESPDGKVRIGFPAPLGGRSIDIAGDTDHRVVVEQGRFPYQCGITRPDGTMSAGRAIRPTQQGGRSSSSAADRRWRTFRGASAFSNRSRKRTRKRGRLDNR